MKKTLLFTFCLLTISFTTGIAQRINPVEAPYIHGEMIVQLKAEYSIDQLIATLPVYTEVKSKECLSEHMRFWLLEFNSNAISNPEMKRLLMFNGAVQNAQNNHYVHERSTVPNDPNIGSQWHHINNGGGGGVADADIDSDLAWDVTTGGLTAQGDTIVICLVEGGGANYSHVDLAQNFWRNHQEIPNNSIDDDGNGYVDDYEGWRVSNSTDNHQTGTHGTQCMGMMGAKGNNSVGVVGANWNVKVMLVSGFSTAESSVIAGYNYPLVMRKRYNQSNGANGAFVVATSASWGIDAADPLDYPLWCAFYDTLGVYGILNVGATTNSNLNVDAVGDMPTACSSPYMISVTRTGNADNQAGGYGQTTIDLGAPGINVYTTTGTTSYGTTTGTSFSCPLTAGVIALMYSVPCPSLMTLVKADPQAGADEIRLALLDGVDPKSSLTTTTVTGGRLNANNSVVLLMTNCGTGTCVTPYNLTATNINDNDADLSWTDGGGSSTFWLRYREVGAPIWDSVLVNATTYNLTGLNSCTSYEYQVLSDCGSGDVSAYSAISTFDTDGCCVAPATLSASVTNDTTAVLTWSSVLAATGYNLQLSTDGGTTWTSLNNVSSPLTIDTLSVCTDYEFQVQTICNSTTTSFSSSELFATAGCGACEDLTYCSNPGGAVTDEWIQTVELNTINNNSGANGGYASFTGITTQLEEGNSYPVTITPGYTGTAFTEYVKVWIDYNQNGVFSEPSELAFSNASITSATTGTISIPGTALLGVTRMRVAMKYVGAGDNGSPTACGTFAFGEIEDYCVEIVANSGNSVAEEPGYKLLIFPNPADNNLTVQFFGEYPEAGNYSFINAVGQEVITGAIKSNKTDFDLSELPNGIYFMKVVENGKTLRTIKVVVSH